MTDKWIEVDPEKVNPPRTESLDGVEVTVLMSPYDIPRALKGEYNEREQRFLIEFRYLGEEDTYEDTPHEHVTLENERRRLGAFPEGDKDGPLLHVRRFNSDGAHCLPHTSLFARTT